MNFFSGKRIFLFSFCLFIFIGCSFHPPTLSFKKNGKVYGKIPGLFRGKWWHYYQRGISYLEGGYYQHALREIKERLSISSLPFNIGPAGWSLKEALENDSLQNEWAAPEGSYSFSSTLLTKLFHRERFSLIGREDLEGILRELKLGGTRLVDERYTLRKGKLQTARAFLSGRIIVWDNKGKKGIEIKGYLKETETGKIIASNDVYAQIEGDYDDHHTLAEGMALQFHRKFPLLEGDIEEIADGVIVTSLGKGEVKTGRNLYWEKGVEKITRALVCSTGCENKREKL